MDFEIDVLIDLILDHDYVAVKHHTGGKWDSISVLLTSQYNTCIIMGVVSTWKAIHNRMKLIKKEIVLNGNNIFIVTIGGFFELEISLKRYVFLRAFKREWFKDLDSSGPLISEDEMKQIEIIRDGGHYESTDK